VTLTPFMDLDDLRTGLSQLPADVTSTGPERGRAGAAPGRRRTTTAGTGRCRPHPSPLGPTRRSLLPEVAVTRTRSLVRAAIAAAALAAAGSLIRSMVEAVTR
jgi:hypothetical protein